MIVSLLIAPSQDPAVGTAARVESPSTSESSIGSRHISDSATHAAGAQEMTQLANRSRAHQSPECVSQAISPGQSSPDCIPTVSAQERGGEVESPAPPRTVPTINTIPSATNDIPGPVLHAVNPETGPTSGGSRISLYVSNLDSRTRVYPRFGSNVGRIAVRYVKKLSN